MGRYEVGGYVMTPEVTSEDVKIEGVHWKRKVIKQLIWSGFNECWTFEVITRI